MTYEPELLVHRRDDDIVVLTLNRPKARKTVSFGMWEQFSRALDGIENATPARGDGATVARSAAARLAKG